MRKLFGLVMAIGLVSALAAPARAQFMVGMPAYGAYGAGGLGYSAYGGYGFMPGYRYYNPGFNPMGWGGMPNYYGSGYGGLVPMGSYYGSPMAYGGYGYGYPGYTSMGYYPYVGYSYPYMSYGYGYSYPYYGYYGYPYYGYGYGYGLGGIVGGLLGSILSWL